MLIPVGSLNLAPALALRRAPFRLFRRVPPERRRVEQHLGPEKGRDTRGFRVPLVPADENADRGVPGLPHFEAAGLARSGTRDWGLGTGDSGLGTRDPGPGTRDPGSGLRGLRFVGRDGL